MGNGQNLSKINMKKFNLKFKGQTQKKIIHQTMAQKIFYYMPKII